VAQQSRRRRKRRARDHYTPPVRSPSSAPREERPATPRPVGRRTKREGPPAPWGSFPLVELVVLIALVLLIAGVFVQGTRGVTMIGAGIALGSLAGLELSIREHFAGYKSHTTVLSTAIGVAVLAVAFVVNDAQPSVAGLVAGAATFAVAFYLFREAFKRRSGGVGWR
jgi:uncharacterized membrane protein